MTRPVLPFKTWLSLHGFTGSSQRAGKTSKPFLSSLSVVFLVLVAIVWVASNNRPLVRDTDGDGRWNEKLYFRKGILVKKLVDSNGDGRVDLWVFYREGVPKRMKHDSNYDGRVDLWAFYEGGEISRVKTDLNFDGKVDYDGPYRLNRKKGSADGKP